MILSTEQVAEKLGISKKSVYKLRDEGKLTDLAKRKEGAKKHYSKFNSKEVNALNNGNRPERKKVEQPQPVSTPNILVRLEERLIHVEAMLSALTDMWR